MAEKLIETSELNEAKGILEKILNEFPNNCEALNDLAVIEILSENWDVALNYLNRIIEIDSNNEIALGNLQYIFNKIEKQ
jgi:tetratricopeptide (TPR) repeat protein